MKTNKYVIVATILYICSMVIPFPVDGEYTFGYQIALEGLSLVYGFPIIFPKPLTLFINLPNFAFIVNIVLIYSKQPGSFWLQILGCIGALYWIPNQLLEGNYSFFINPLYYMWLMSQLYLLIGVVKIKEHIMHRENIS